MQKIRVFEAFAGYGSQLMALKRLQAAYPNEIEIEPIGISEIDPHAIKAYQAVHGDVTNYGDISKIDWSQVPDFDFFTYSSPCTDFSNAGKQMGGEEGSGTRSSLLWECRRAILAKKPKYLLMENVAALVQAKFIKLFNKWQLELESYGYKNFAKVLNAKNYNVPQNRERIFMVSILDENAKFEFPKPMPLTRKLKDVLEKDVDEKYYLSEERLQGLKISTTNNDIKKVGSYNNGQSGVVLNSDGISGTVDASASQHGRGVQILEPKIKTVGNLYDNTNGGKAAGVVIDDGGGLFSTLRAGDNSKLIEYGEKDRVENIKQC